MGAGVNGEWAWRYGKWAWGCMVSGRGVIWRVGVGMYGEG